MRSLLPLLCLLLSACDCAGPGLVGRDGDPAFHDAFGPPVIDGGIPEGPGGQGGGGGGPQPGSTRILGTIWQYAAALPPSALHPNVPVAGAVAHLRKASDPTTDLATATTAADGTFSFEVAANVAYGIHTDVPAELYSEPDYFRQLLPIAEGESRRFDDYFHLRGISFVVRDAKTGQAIEGVNARVVDGSQVLQGPELTDAEGYVHLDASPRQATLRLEHPRYQPLEMSSPSIDTSHTVLGGCVLTPVQ